MVSSKKKAAEKAAEKRRAAKRERNRVKRQNARKQTASSATDTKLPNSVSVKYDTPHDLMNAGPLVEAQWNIPTALAKILLANGRPVPGPVTGYMLVDTGASKTCIAEDAAVELGLRSVGRAKSFGAHGQGETDKYMVHFRFSIVDAKVGRVDIDSEMIAASVPKLNEAYSAFQVRRSDGHPVRLIGLLGREFLRHGRFIYDGEGGSFSMTLSLESFNRPS